MTTPLEKSILENLEAVTSSYVALKEKGIANYVQQRRIGRAQVLIELFETHCADNKKDVKKLELIQPYIFIQYE